MCISLLALEFACIRVPPHKPTSYTFRGEIRKFLEWTARDPLWKIRSIDTVLGVDKLAHGSAFEFHTKLANFSKEVTFLPADWFKMPAHQHCLKSSCSAGMREVWWRGTKMWPHVNIGVASYWTIPACVSLKRDLHFGTKRCLPRQILKYDRTLPGGQSHIYRGFSLSVFFFAELNNLTKRFADQQVRPQSCEGNHRGTVIVVGTCL